MVKDSTPDYRTDHSHCRRQGKNCKRPALKTAHSRAQLGDAAHVNRRHGKKADQVRGLLNIYLEDGAGQPKRPWLTVLIDPHTRKVIHFDLRLEEEGDR